MMTKRRDGELGDYDVGYGKPPVHTRFQPGNRAAANDGRPRRRKPRTFESMLAHALSRKVAAQRPDGSRATMTYLELMVLNFLATAQKPHSIAGLRALKMMMEMMPMAVEDRATQSMKIEYVDPDPDRFGDEFPFAAPKTS